MYFNNNNSFRSTTPTVIRAPTIDTYQLVTTSDITFYQLSLEVKTHSHDSEIEGAISITNSCSVDFKIVSTFLIPQKNTLVLISNSNKFGLFDLSGGRLKYYLYPTFANDDVPFIVTDISWVNQTSSLYFSCVDLPIQCFNFSTKQWDQPIEATIDYPDITKILISHCQKYLCFLTETGSLYYYMFGANIIEKVEIPNEKLPTLIRFVPNSQPYLVLGYPKGKVEVINLKVGSILSYEVRDLSTVIDVSFYPYNKNTGLIVTSTGRLLLLDIGNMTITPKTMLNKSVHNMHYGLEGHTIITSDFENTFHIFNRAEPSKLLSSIKIDTQFPISRFMPVRCRKWNKIVIETEKTLSNSSNSCRRRNTIALSSANRTGSNLAVSNPTSPTIKHNMTTNSIRLNSHSFRPKSVQSFISTFSPEKEHRQSVLSNRHGTSKPNHSASKSHLPKLESRLTQAQVKGLSRSQKSDSSSKSGESSNHGSSINGSAHQILKSSSAITNGYHTYRPRDRINHSKSRSESSNLFKEDKVTPSQASDSGHISEDLHYNEERLVSKNGSQTSSNSKRSSSINSTSPPVQLLKLDSSNISSLSPTQSHIHTDDNIQDVAITTTQSKIEQMLEQNCYKIEIKVQEKMDIYQTLVSAQTNALKEQLLKMNQALEPLPKMMEQIRQLKEENKKLQDQNIEGGFWLSIFMLGSFVLYDWIGNPITSLPFGINFYQLIFAFVYVSVFFIII